MIFTFTVYCVIMYLVKIWTFIKIFPIFTVFLVFIFKIRS